MRLPEIDRGDGVFNRLLIGFISLASRMRLPDAARVALYHKDFFGAPLGAWTQAAMRGPSTWSVGERELMAALAASGIRAPSASALRRGRGEGDGTIGSRWGDCRLSRSPISESLKATLAFLEILTLRPMELTAEDAKGRASSQASASKL